MGISVFPAPSAASKTRYVETLTSGSSWTVPTGVTYVNVTLTGGGGGGGGTGDTATVGGAGGTTTFTGATSATGGYGGASGDRDTPNTGASGPANSGSGADGAHGFEGSGSVLDAHHGGFGAIISSNVSTTPGNTISYGIGAGGTAGPEKQWNANLQ
jgi:hypothetical protein